MEPKRKNFIVKNDGFVCDFCGEKSPPAEQTCRNHCRKCLTSKHVDDVVPGDRESRCLGKMEAVDFDYSGAKGHQIIHECAVCGKRMKNMLASDDDLNVFNTLPYVRNVRKSS